MEGHKKTNPFNGNLKRILGWGITGILTIGTMIAMSVRSWDNAQKVPSIDLRLGKVETKVEVYEERFKGINDKLDIIIEDQREIKTSLRRIR